MPAWTCPGCGLVLADSITTCPRCGTGKPTNNVTAVQPIGHDRVLAIMESEGLFRSLMAVCQASTIGTMTPDEADQALDDLLDIADLRSPTFDPADLLSARKAKP